jgi:hypothetical protein
MAYFLAGDGEVKRYIPRDKLVSLLSDLPENTAITITARELGVYDIPSQTQLGFISIGNECYERFE